jgi:hypothetical protein
VQRVLLHVAADALAVSCATGLPASDECGIERPIDHLADEPFDYEAAAESS